MNVVKWSPSDEGYTDSHCGRFSICPQFEGTTRAQSYRLDEYHPLTLQVCKRNTHDTQRDAKAEATRVVNVRIIPKRGKQ